MKILVVLVLALLSSPVIGSVVFANGRPIAHVIERNGVPVEVRLLNRKGEVTHQLPLQPIGEPPMVAVAPPTPTASKPKTVRRATTTPVRSVLPRPRPPAPAELVFASLERLYALPVVEP